MTDSFADTQNLLGPWIECSNILFFPPVAFLLALATTWLATGVALRPVQAGRHASWVEKARLVYPGRVVLSFHLLTMPLFFGAIAHFFAGPLSRVPEAMLVTVSGSAALAATLLGLHHFANHWSENRVTFPLALRWLVFTLARSAPLWVCLVLLILLPSEMDATAVLVLAMGAPVLLFLMLDGGISPGRVVGLITAGDQRLQTLVRAAAWTAHIQPAVVTQISLPSANVWAFPLPRCLVFTDRLTRILNDEQLNALAVDSLVRLPQRRHAVILGISVTFPMLMMSSLKPVIGSYGLETYVPLFFTSILMFAAIAIWLRRCDTSRRGRMRAVRENVADAYFSALEKIYEADLIPVVYPGRTRRGLYDRLLRAGRPPSYPRPHPPSQERVVASISISVAILAILTPAAMVTPCLDWAGLGQNETGLNLAAVVRGGQPETLARLGLLYEERGQLTDAATLLRASTELDSKSVLHPARLAIVLAKLDRLDSAETAFREAERRYALSNNPALGQLMFEARQAIEQRRLDAKK
jgi:hypothetical protein